MKVHLGCGQKYLTGYYNIDFPLANHSVQQDSVADKHFDITLLQYGEASIDEVRLHHVFEHFPRSIACALVASWSSWLRDGGVLHIEVPDLAHLMKVFLNPFSCFEDKAIAERHLFGSHEAHWARHFEGYNVEMLKRMIEPFGFNMLCVKKTHWLGTYNIETKFKRSASKFDKGQCESLARKYLGFFLVDSSDSELRLLEIWIKQFVEQLNKTYGIDA